MSGLELNLLGSMMLAVGNTCKKSRQEKSMGSAFIRKLSIFYDHRHAGQVETDGLEVLSGRVSVLFLLHAHGMPF